MSVNQTRSGAVAVKSPPHEVLVRGRRWPVPVLALVEHPDQSRRTASAGRPVCGRTARPGRGAARRGPAGRRRCRVSRCAPCVITVGQLTHRQRPVPRAVGPTALVVASNVARSAPGRSPRRETVVGQLLDQRDHRFGRTFSRAKYAEARLRISISISRTRLRRRSSTSSALLGAGQCLPCGRHRPRRPRIHRRRHDSLIPRSFATRAPARPARQIKGTSPELRRLSSRHTRTPLRGDHRLRSGVRESGSGSTRCSGHAALRAPARSTTVNSAADRQDVPPQLQRCS